MQALFDLIDNPLVPAALLPRELTIQSAVDSHYPLYVDLCRIAGQSTPDLTPFVRHRDIRDLLDLSVQFTNRRELPAGCIPLNGKLDPYKTTDVRNAFIVWCAHQTPKGGLAPFFRSLKRAMPDVTIRSKSHKAAFFAAHAWAASRPLDFSWGAVSRTVYRGLEGSNRSHSGKAFEEGVREAVRQAVESSFKGYSVSAKEISVAGNNGKRSRVDIVVDTGARTLLFPCKSTQTGDTSHAPLFYRDVRDSIASIGADPNDVMMVMGGEGWTGVAKDCDFATLSVPSPFPMTDYVISNIRDGIIESGILSN